MIGNEKELNFEQYIAKINIGKFSFFEKNERVLFLSKGIIIAHNKEIVFYDFKKYSKILIMSIEQEDLDYKNSINISKLLNDKFCVYTNKETLIYQLNGNSLEISLVKIINVNLGLLIELEKDVYVNITDKYVYIWKKLQSIYKINQIYVMIFCFIINLFLIKHLYNFRTLFQFLISAIFDCILMRIFRNYKYLLNPYNRIKNNSILSVKEFRNNQCLIKTSQYLGIYNYRKNMWIKKIITSWDKPSLWAFFIINENIIILTKSMNIICKIYDTRKDKIFDIYNINFIIDYKNTFKIAQNLFISLDYNSKEMIQWTYNFELNNINILSRKKHNFIIIYNIEYCFNDNKLYILNEGESDSFDMNNNNLYIDVFKVKWH